MGNSLSLIVERLYPLQEEERLDELRRLLRDQQLSSSLIEGSKSAELSILVKPTKQTDVRLTLRHLKIDPLVWKPDKEMIERWSANISTFWTSPAWTARFHHGQLAYVYDSYFDLAIRQGEDVLRARFSVLFFYDLLCFLYPQHSRSAPPSIYERFAKVIKNHSSRNEPLKAVASTLSELVGRGRRYNKLTETFGPGIIVELPVDVSRSVVETRLPLDDENAYNNVVKGIADLNLKKQAEENGSNELAKEIRKTALTPFFFMAEDPTLYNHRRTEIDIVSSNPEPQPQETEGRPNPHFINPQQSSTANIDELQPAVHNTVQQFETEQSSRQRVLTRSPNPAAAALILLRNPPEQFAKRIRANPSRADQLNGATPYYIAASSPDSSNTVNGLGEGNGASAAQLPQQDQLQGESPLQLASTNIIQGANVSTRDLDTAPVGRYELVLGQAYDTSSDNVNDGPDVRFGNPDPHYSFASSQPVVQNVHVAPQGSLEANNHVGATCGSVAPLVLPDANTQQPARGFMQNLSLENATHPALHGRNPVMNNDLTIDQSQSNIHRGSEEGNGASAAQLPQQDTSNDATGGNLDTGWMHTAANAIDSQWDSMDPNALWVHNGASAIESQWDPMNPNAVWMHNGAGAIESQWDPMNPNLMGAFVLNGTYR